MEVWEKLSSMYHSPSWHCDLQLSQREGTRERSCCTNCPLQTGQKEREEPKASITHIDGKCHRIRGSELKGCSSPIPFQRIISGKSFGFKFVSVPHLMLRLWSQRIRPVCLFSALLPSARSLGRCFGYR